MSTHTKQKKYIVTVVVAALIVVGIVSAYLIPSQTTLTIIPITQEEQERNEALGIAQRYIVTSPTFAFDGDINTLDVEYMGSAESFPPQYMFTMAFDSSHGGYGNREGQMLTQAITHHKMDIVVSEGNVISAVTDKTWDEINHQYVLKQKLPSSNEQIEYFDGSVTDYQSLVLALKSRGLEVKETEEINDSVFAVPITVLSVAGMDLQVYEFGSESSTNEAIQIVSPDGTEIGTSVIRWIDEPHFYSQGKIIVQYIGHNPEMLSVLDSLLGNQFAGM